METQSINHNPQTPAAESDKNALLVSKINELYGEKLHDVLQGKPVPVPYKTFHGGRTGSVHESWYGRPDVYRGLIRKVAHLERAQSEVPYARMLYSEGGRKGDPWGACNLEINGHVYHFGGGLKRFPVLIKDAKPTALALQMLANGIPGQMECDATDWRWVQGEVDLTQLLTQESIAKLGVLFHEYHTDPTKTPIFQSRKHAETHGVPLYYPDTHNCTTIVTDALKNIGGLDIPQCLPVEAFKDAVDMVSTLPAQSHDSLDHALSALMCMDYIWLKRLVKSAFKKAHVKPKHLTHLVKPTPEIGTSFPDVDMLKLLDKANEWLGTQWQ